MRIRSRASLDQIGAAAAGDDGADPLAQMCRRLKGTKSLVIVPHATHLFAEKGALDAAIDHATRWFVRHFDTPKG